MIKAGLCTAGEGFLAFGDNLYRMPERMPGLKGLKVLRPGLHLGTLKKNRFEPAHALALALRPKDVKHVWKLSVEEACLSEGTDFFRGRREGLVSDLRGRLSAWAGENWPEAS